MNVFDRWRREPISFICEVLRNPATGKPFELFPAQRQFFEHCWQTDADGRALYPLQLFGAIKKSAKSGTAAIHLLTTTILYGGRFAEAYCLANDRQQAQERVFAQICAIIKASPLLQNEAQITQTKITFPRTGTTIQAIGADYTGSAGGNPVISSFDELWSYVDAADERLWAEFVPVPTRKFSIRLVTTHAGFAGESKLLEELYRRGMALPLIGDGLRGGDGMLFCWYTTPICTWQDEAWLAQMRRDSSPAQYLRQCENQFVPADTASFLNPERLDICILPHLTPAPNNKALSVWVAVDYGMTRDSTAIIVVFIDAAARSVYLARHYIFQGSPEEPLDIEDTVERTLLDLAQSFDVKQIVVDPWQMRSTIQRLAKAGLPIVEFEQTPGNQTNSSQCLFNLVKRGQLVMYPDPELRLALSRATAIETSRGLRIGKSKQSDKIDAVVALAMACYAALSAPVETDYNTELLAKAYSTDFPTEPTTQEERNREYWQGLRAHIMATTGHWVW